MDYVEWLAARNRPREEISGRITKQDARQSARAFRIRAATAVDMKDWQTVLQMLEEGSLLDETASWLLRARAEDALSRTAAARTSVRKALEAAIKTMSLPDALAETDAMGPVGSGQRGSP